MIRFKAVCQFVLDAQKFKLVFRCRPACRDTSRYSNPVSVIGMKAKYKLLHNFWTVRPILEFFNDFPRNFVMRLFFI